MGHVKLTDLGLCKKTDVPDFGQGGMASAAAGGAVAPSTGEEDASHSRYALLNCRHT